MCCRYTLKDIQAVVALCAQLGVGIDLDEEDLAPRYNAALTQAMPVVTRRGGRVRLEKMSFGLTSPARTPAERPTLLANARAETLLAKPAFRDAAQHRRCLVPADGFYEWEKAGAARLPHYFYLQEHRPFFFAGLWQPETEAAPAAFAVVTTTPNALLRPIHDRMPVVLGPNSGPAWLGDQPLDPARVAQLCRPLPASMMASHRVDPRMNRTAYEAPDCIASLPG
ncbi:MAG: SOS response-associated peptidase [Opitutae bacterium]|nr:SOS response-associated peptidase [Opitutae bacterium]